MSEHYFNVPVDSDPGEARLVHISARGRELDMWISHRVFSTRRLDPGTEQLLAALPPLPHTGRFLDLGCGWGAISVVAALESPQATVIAVDINPHALTLTKRNALANGATNVRCLDASTALEECAAQAEKFDLILSNPPVRIGKDALHQLLVSWLSLLAPTGVAWLVMGKNLGADSLIPWLNSQGFVAEKYSSRKGYRIIRVTLAQ